MTDFIALTDSEILDYLGKLECEQKDLKEPYCAGETAFYKKKMLCQDCPARKQCMDLEAQKFGLLMILENRMGEDEIFNEES